MGWWRGKEEKGRRGKRKEEEGGRELMEGVVEGQRREGEKGQKQVRERREGINGGGRGKEEGEALKDKQVQEGGGERKGEEEEGWGRWQIFWLATIAVALGTKAHYCYVCQPKYLLVHKTSYSACPKNTLLFKYYT